MSQGESCRMNDRGHSESRRMNNRGQGESCFTNDWGTSESRHTLYYIKYNIYTLYIATSHMSHVLVYYTLLVVIIICIMFVKLRKCWRM